MLALVVVLCVVDVNDDLVVVEFITSNLAHSLL